MARKVGLARAISKLGYCSRSRAEELIRRGVVRMNGVVRRDVEAPVHLGKDRIEIDGKRVGESAKIYLMMNKVRGVVTTASDEQGRETIYKYLEKGLPWVAPVGRLDKASEGLLLITNDTAWAARITAPESGIEKTYHVQVAARLSAGMVEKLILGMVVKDGEFLRVRQARLIREGEKNCWVEIVLDEGRNRHIRRMFETMAVEILRLIRVRIGGLELGELAKGAVRELSVEERGLLFRKSTAV
jgi:23S rRNA pseudouridine2605 synthase